MKKITIVLFILLLTSCQEVVNNDDIKINTKKTITISWNIEPEPEIKENKFLWAWYYRKTDGIYYFDDKIKNADRDSFELLNNPIWSEYGVDKENAFGFWNHLKWADLDSFKVTSFRYAVDKNNVYCFWEKLEWADTNSFKNNDIWDTYALDKNNVYFNCDVISWADVNSFEVIKWWEWVAKDKNNIYCWYEKINSIDRDSYTEFYIESWKRGKILSQYSKDKNNVYYWCSYIIEEADPDSFEIINPFFAKDKNNVYKYNKILEWIDPNNYTIEELEKMEY